MWRMQNAGAQRSALCGCCCAAVWGLSPGSRHKVRLVPSVLPLLACRADTLPEQILRAGIHWQSCSSGPLGLRRGVGRFD